jgi:hypothetical protein
MDAESLEPGRRGGSVPADRPLPVRLTQRPAARSTEQPRVRHLGCTPAIHDRHQVHDQRHRPVPVVLQSVHVQRAATATGQHNTAQPQTRARDRHPVTDLKPGQLTPSESGERQHGHHVAVPTFARRRQRPQLIEGEGLAVPAGPAAGWLANRRCHAAASETPTRSARLTRHTSRCAVLTAGRRRHRAVAYSRSAAAASARIAWRVTMPSEGSQEWRAGWIGGQPGHNASPTSGRRFSFAACS